MRPFDDSWMTRGLLYCSEFGMSLSINRSHENAHGISTARKVLFLPIVNDGNAIGHESEGHGVA